MLFLLLNYCSVNMTLMSEMERGRRGNIKQPWYPVAIVLFTRLPVQKWNSYSSSPSHSLQELERPKRFAYWTAPR